jgi:hypothetical protein
MREAVEVVGLLVFILLVVLALIGIGYRIGSKDREMHDANDECPTGHYMHTVVTRKGQNDRILYHKTQTWFVCDKESK